MNSADVQYWGTVAEWVSGLATAAAVLVALFQDYLRSVLFAPRLTVSVVNAPPDCVWVPYRRADGSFLADSLYVRVRIRNRGHSVATDVEVYAERLRRLEPNGTWADVAGFPPMNLQWADVGGVTMPILLPNTAGKHCTVGYVIDPSARWDVETNPKVGHPGETTLSFALVVAPYHKGHIIPPGTYHLDIVVGARNARPVRATISIALDGRWFPWEAAMLERGIHVELVREADQ